MKNAIEKWTVCNKTGDLNFIINTFGVTAPTARLLINRGLSSEKDIREFLYPDETMMHSQKLMKDLCGAADIIEEKLSSRKRFRVIGDYDADGIMSTYILSDVLKKLGAEADFYIPDRIKDGYGINGEMIRKAAEDGIDTVITCDNGIAAVPAAEAAKECGITLIVTDHHELPEELPDANILVDPKRPDETYPCRDICGAVVAAKLGAELLERRGLAPAGRGCLKYLEFMAIATICDVVPLTGENRTIAALGLKILNSIYLKNENPDGREVNIGLKALIDLCQIKNEINEHTIGFIIGPCLNATGRLDLAGRAMDMLNAKDPQEALSSAEICRDYNEERKNMTVEETQKAFAMLDEQEDLDRVLVVELPECHESLAGIIAGRIKEKYYRPVFVLTKAKEGVKGSGRSIPGYNMFGEMQKCSDLFTKFGGHPMAAGLSIPEENVSEFRRRLNENCTLSDEDLRKKVLLDAIAWISGFDEKGVEELKLFAPCGTDNPTPLFADRNNRVVRMRRIGKNNNFLRFTMEDSKGVRYNAVCFKDADEIVESLTGRFGRESVEAAFEGRDNDISLALSYVPEINEFNGVKSIQMKIQGILF